MSEYEIRLQNTTNALARLEEALAIPDSNEFRVEICIKRFEFTYETFKKLLEDALRLVDIFTKNPREVVKEAEKQGFITSIKIWDAMRDDRNDTTHEDDEKKAVEIIKNIPSYAKEFKFVLEKVSKINA